MKGSRGGDPSDANRRLAMVWGDGDTVRDPEGATYDRSKQVKAGAAQQRPDPDSLYTYYKKLIMIRKANPAIARGEYKSVSVEGTKVGGFTAAWEGTTVLVLHNPTKKAQIVDLSAIGDFTDLRAVIGQQDASITGTTLTIGGQTSVVLG